MRTLETVRRILRPLEASIHLARLQCWCRMAFAVLYGGQLSLTALGRALPTQGTTKNAIKRVDAFLGNPRLVGDAEAIQRYFATLLVKAPETRPVLLVDWSDIGKLWTALVVTYVADGRGLALCWEVHPQARKNSAKIETKVLSRLAALLPDGTKPIVVADAGFRGPWFSKIRQRGWDFVGRVRGRVQVRSEGGKWQSVKALWATAERTPKELGDFQLARYKPVKTRLISLTPKCLKKKKKKKDLPAVGRRKKRNIQSAREPLILATSLPSASASAKEVAELYALRWQIEMTFRDQKCSRFGLGLDAVRTKKLARARAYVLLAALAHYVAYMLGAAAEKAGLAPQFQANTVRSRRVLSLPRLGCELLRRGLTRFLFEPSHPTTTSPIVTFQKCGDP